MRKVLPHVFPPTHVFTAIRLRITLSIGNPGGQVQQSAGFDYSTKISLL